MLHRLAMLLQTAAAGPPPETGWWQAAKDFIDTPAPYSPFSEYLLLLFILWLVARLEHARDQRRKSFEKQAQDVLQEKYEQGELSRAAFEKFRQDVSIRPRH
jgi:hypothetical protein